jgi:hypothetical protein
MHPCLRVRGSGVSCVQITHCCIAHGFGRSHEGDVCGEYVDVFVVVDNIVRNSTGLCTLFVLLYEFEEPEAVALY